tara:strand:+ start:170 stop:598 length:429 start_codon:yes stop_codon:yes gene_type:complete
MGVRQDIIASKSAIETKLNVSNEGILTVGYGGVYVSVEVITALSLSGTTDSFVDETSVTTTTCEACGEEAVFVTAVTDHTATAVTGVSLTPTTEEHLMPVMFDDEFGNAHPVVMGTDRWDSTRTIGATATEGTAGEGTPDPV